MQVQFAGSRQADIVFVLALWHELMSAWHPEIIKPLEAPIRQRHAKETLASYLQAGGENEAPRLIAERACGFDIVLRLASGRIDLMHATSDFFDHPDNRKWFTRIPTRPATVRLTDLALATWNGTTEARRETALEEARRLLESDIESGGVIVRLLPRQDAEKTGTDHAEDGSAFFEEEPDMRTRYLKALVRDIHTEPFQPVYRRRPIGKPVTGWDARLQAYFGQRLIAATRRLLSPCRNLPSCRGNWHMH
jgi:hypothetical protein